MDFVSWRELLYRRKNLREVRHITLDPAGPGVVRLHMVPPKSLLRRDVPYTLILNGQDILPLNMSWAVLLANFIDAMEPYAGQPIAPNQWDELIDQTLYTTRWVYPRTEEEFLRQELARMLESLKAIARGEEPPEPVGLVSLGEYARWMQAPHRMDLMVSAMEKEGRWHCNQKCLHCYAAGQPAADTPELTTAQWKQVLNVLKDACIPQVTFTGGEPTMRPDLVELVDAARWFVTRLNTNGRLLTPELCARLVEASLDSVQITLYSDDPQVHNTLVGAAGFADTEAGIQNALDAGLSVSINTPLCSLNADYPATLRYLHRMGVRYVTCSGLIPTGGALTEDSAATRLDGPALEQILHQSVAYCHQNGMEINFTSPGWLPEQTLLDLGLPSAPTCGAALSNMAIGPDGMVVPCQSWLSGQGLGNILTTPWKQIWNSPECSRIRAESAKMEHICQLRPQDWKGGADPC